MIKQDTPDEIARRKLPAITVHGRFQPPIHINHWHYIQEGFSRAEHVTLLITNPFNDEAYDAAASWRNSPDSNPFSYQERVQMFHALLGRLGIDQSRYTIKPFNIKDLASFQELDPNVPNLVNIYSEWSEKKDALFLSQGLKTVRLEMPKTVAVSGTTLREIIFTHQSSDEELAGTLVKAGMLKEAIPGLLQILQERNGIVN